MALLHRRGSGGFRWAQRVMFGLIMMSFGICITTTLVFMFFQNPSNISCPSSCYCDCSLQDFLPISSQFIKDNYSIGEIDPEMIEELRKDRATLIIEELNLLNIVNEERMKRYKSLTVDAKKSSAQYKKEAESCYVGVRTCEEARERAQEMLVEECKLTALWQKRAEMLAKP